MRTLIVSLLIMLTIATVYVAGRQLFIIADPNTVALTARAELKVVEIRSWFEPDQVDPNRVTHHIVEVLEQR